jgi:hypothetical protein
MPQQKAGGGLLAKVSRTPAPSPTLADQSVGVSHCTPETHECRVLSGTNARKRHYFLTDLAMILGLIGLFVAFCVGYGWLEAHRPLVIAGFITVACIAVVGVLVAAAVAGPKA